MYQLAKRNCYESPDLNETNDNKKIWTNVKRPLLLQNKITLKDDAR